LTLPGPRILALIDPELWTLYPIAYVYPLDFESIIRIPTPETLKP